MTSPPNFRLLTVAMGTCMPALDPAAVAALPGFAWIGDAADCNEGLRQILMVRPDVVVVPWSAATLKLLRALAHWRHHHPAPVVVAVTPEALPHAPPPREGVITVGIDELDARLVDRLRQLLPEVGGAPRLELLLKPH